MIGTGAAILGAGLLGAGASIWGAQSASNSQREAAELAAATQREGLAFQREGLDFQRGVYGNQLGNYDEARGNFANARGGLQDSRNNLGSWISSGQNANNLLSSFYGLGTDPALGQSALARFYESPDYQFAMKSGVGALDNSASAKGSLLSGNQLRAVTEYGQGLGTQTLGNYLSRLSGISQQGQQAVGAHADINSRIGSLGMQLGQLGTNLGTGVSSVIGNTANSMAGTTNNIGQSQMAAGTAEAAGTLGTVRGINSGLNALSLYNQMGQSSYGRGALANYNGNQIGGIY